MRKKEKNNKKGEKQNKKQNKNNQKKTKKNGVANFTWRRKIGLDTKSLPGHIEPELGRTHRNSEHMKLKRSRSKRSMEKKGAVKLWPASKRRKEEEKKE